MASRILTDFSRSALRLLCDPKTLRRVAIRTCASSSGTRDFVSLNPSISFKCEVFPVTKWEAEKKTSEKYKSKVRKEWVGIRMVTPCLCFLAHSCYWKNCVLGRIAYNRAKSQTVPFNLPLIQFRYIIWPVCVK